MFSEILLHKTLHYIYHSSFPFFPCEQMSKALLLAIFTVAALANGVLGRFTTVSMNFIGNQAQPSVATAEFRADQVLITGPTPIEFGMLLPGTPNDYKDIRCDLELSMESFQPAARRTRRVNAKVAATGENNVVSITSKATLDVNDVLGKLQFACEFIAPNIQLPWVTVTSSAKFDGYDVELPQLGMIRHWRSAVTSFQSFLGSGSRETVFAFGGIDDALSSNSFSITNSTTEGTSATPVKFSGLEKSYCDGYWDGVLYQQSLVAQISADGSTVHFLLGGPLNSAKNLTVVCPQVYGFAQNPLVPSVLKAVFSSEQNTFLSFARVHSEARPAPTLLIEEVSAQKQLLTHKQLSAKKLIKSLNGN